VWLVIGTTPPCAAQYYLRDAETLPDSHLVLGIQRMTSPITYEDVASSGMGKIMLLEIGKRSPYEKNPALLARPASFSGSFWVDAAMPLETLDAIVFISDNEVEFESGSVAKLAYEEVRQYLDDPSAKPQIGAEVEKLLEIPRQMVTKAIGNLAYPRINNANLSLNLKVRAGNWAFHLSGTAQTAFAIRLGPVYGELMDILLTTNFADHTSLDFALRRLEGIGDQIVDPRTGVVSQEALPAIYALNYADLVASVGYGFTPVDGLELGVAARILNRRFAVDRVNVDDTKNLAERWLAGLKSGSTGLTFDIGGIYTPSPRLQIAATLQNLIPTQTLRSSFELDFLRASVAGYRDSTGRPVVNADGDTALAVWRQKVIVEGPAELSLPFWAEAGVVYRASEDLDLAFEVVDIVAQEERFDSYWERLRFGAEYRFRFLDGTLVVPVRMGLAETIPTFGAGIELARTMRLDVGYFPSSRQKNRTLGVQVTVNW